MWQGRIRKAGGRTRGVEIDARIGRVNGTIMVDYVVGKDAAGKDRYRTITPHELDPESLCEALLEGTPPDPG